MKSLFCALSFLLSSPIHASLITDFDDHSFQVPNVGRISLWRALRWGCKSLLTTGRAALAFNHQGLGLVMGEMKNYPRNSPLGKARLKYPNNLYFTLKTEADERRWLRILTTGTSQDLHTVREKLIRARANFGTKIPLAEVLPDFASVELNRGRYDSGQNCFNTALRYWGDDELSAEAYDFEMVKALKNRFKVLKDDEKPQLGDIIVFWSAGTQIGSQYSIQHVAVYLDEDFVFQKATKHNSDPITFQKLEPIVAYYENLKGPIEITVHRRRGR